MRDMGEGVVTDRASPDYGRHRLGAMDQVCRHCGALKWVQETGWNKCCHSGQVRLPAFAEPPPPLDALLRGEHPQSAHFLAHIRKYNQSFQLASALARLDILNAPGLQGVHSLRVHGQVCFNIGPFLFLFFF